MRLVLAAVLNACLLIWGFLTPWQLESRQLINSRRSGMEILQTKVLADDESPSDLLQQDSLIIAVKTSISENWNDQAILKARKNKMFQILKVCAQNKIWVQARFLEGIDTMFLFVQPKEAENLAHLILHTFPEIDHILEEPLRDDGPGPYLLAKRHSRKDCQLKKSSPKICR